MATVYILFSNKLNKYYIGSCKNFTERFRQHQEEVFKGSFTEKANDWKLFYLLDGLTYSQARKIESHIKKMKSKKYVEDLKRYDEMAEKLKAL
jgi:putative endonuclease